MVGFTRRNEFSSRFSRRPCLGDSCLVVAMLVVAAVGVGSVEGQLSMGYYANSCPGAESIITTAVRTASVVDPVLPAKILRLFFHDCFVQTNEVIICYFTKTHRANMLGKSYLYTTLQFLITTFSCTGQAWHAATFPLQGCDGSLLLDSTVNQTTEKDDPINKTVEGYNLVDGIKRSMELLCPGTVSCADIVALAASAAVLQVGGPNVRIPTGRLDGRVSNASVVRFNLPDTNFDLDKLLKFFGSKGLDMMDVVTLAGAHTIGVAHCNAFSERIVFNNTVAQVDPTMNPTFSQTLISKCPAQADPSTTVPLDTSTPTIFDNGYFLDLQTGMGLMTADQTLFTDTRSKATVEMFATDQAAFFESWATAFVKLSGVDVKTGTDPNGEVRKSCRVVNS